MMNVPCWYWNKWGQQSRLPSRPAGPLTWPACVTNPLFDPHNDASIALIGLQGAASASVAQGLSLFRFVVRICRLSSLETELLWQPTILPTSRILSPVLRSAKIWYRCVWVSCRYSISASLWSVKLNRVPALALFAPPVGQSAALIL